MVWITYHNNQPICDPYHYNQPIRDPYHNNQPICDPYHYNQPIREGYSIQHYVIKFVSGLRQVDGVLRVLRFPPPIKLTAAINVAEKIF
jgi:hypothetical protein